jgi:hypothetical protein
MSAPVFLPDRLKAYPGPIPYPASRKLGSRRSFRSAGMTDLVRVVLSWRFVSTTSVTG